jgi:hypothetical protein
VIQALRVHHRVVFFYRAPCLVTQNLIATKNGEWFEITEGGRGFLKWMIDQRLREDKPF